MFTSGNFSRILSDKVKTLLYFYAPKPYRLRMNFRTELHPTPAAYQLSQTSKVVTVGSCFSEVIGRQLEKYKVETLTNPFGTIFNPLSACKLLQVCAGADIELADSFVQNNGRWYSYDFHSSFSAETEEELYEMLDEAIVLTRRFLKKADALILTLGTANIFRLNITGETVANCHKLPANNFTRETLLPEEIITTVAETHSLLRELNPNLKLVLTVSPVRHVKDTLELNSVSKAVLRLATHFLSQNLPEITYFPAYELLIDDLRDYRFYKEDLLHPTPLAETYIWQKFTGAYFETTFQLFTEEWDKILRAKEHKPFHPESPQHQAFIQQTLEKLRTLQEKTDVTEELAWFESQVILLPEPEEEDSEDEDDEEIATANRASNFLDGLETEAGEETLSEKPEPAESFAKGAGSPVPSLTEDGLPRRKKKKKKKKKRPAFTDDTVSLAEVGTTRVPDEVKQEEPTTEAEAELTAVLAVPEHPITHYGETLSEAASEQVRPIMPAKSKSAKRRESRKKKKGMFPAETPFTPEASDEMANLLAPETTSEPSLTFSPQNPTVSEEKTAEITAENSAENVSPKAGKRPAKTRNDRKKKSTFPDLFAPETTEATVDFPGESGKAQVDAAPEVSEAPATTINPEIEIPTPPRTKAPARGRKPKKVTPKNAEAQPVTETIAVPFATAREIMEETPAPAPSKTKSKKPARPAKPKKAPATNPEIEIAVPETFPVPPKAKTKPETKPKAKAKPGAKEKAKPKTKEKPVPETAKTPGKPGRKKKPSVS